MRLVVEQAIQQTVSGSFIAFVSCFMHARRRTGDGFRDHPDVGVRRGNWIAVRAVTDLPTPLAAKQNRGSVLTVPLDLFRVWNSE